MKILIISQYFWPENFRINDVVKDLKSRGNDVEVLTGRPNYPGGKIYKDYKLNQKKYENYYGVRIYRLNSRPRKDGSKFDLFLNYSSFLLRSIVFSLSRLRKNKYDIIFTFGTSPVTTSIIGIILSKFTNSKTVLWVLDLWPDIVFELKIIKNKFIKKIFSKIMNLIYENTDLILAQSNEFKKKIEHKIYGDSKVEVLHQWPEILEKNINKVPLENFQQTDLNIVFTGNIGTAQNFEHVIKVANTCENLNVKWHIIGTGRDLNNIISMGKISKKIKFYGLRDKSEMLNFLYNADVLLISLKEGEAINSTIPGKLQTYLLANKPILGSISGEAAKLITENKIGLVSEPGNEKEFFDNIENFYQQKKQNKLSVDTSKLINLFDKEKILNKLEEKIKDLTKQKIEYLKMIKSVGEINFNKNFILSAINLAFLGYYGNGKMKISQNSIFWPDGIYFSKLYKKKNLKKIPGRDIISNLTLPDEIKKIHVIGNLSNNGKLYLEKKYPGKSIHNTEIPYGEPHELVDNIKKLEVDEITIINLPTPKQEEIARILSLRNKKFKIFCTGGAISMLCGDEPPVPKFIYFFNLEFLWRLRFDTKRRLKRLLETFWYYIIAEYKGKFKKIKIKDDQ